MLSMSLQFVTSLYLLSFSDIANLCFKFRTVYIVSNRLVFMSFSFIPSNLHLIVPKLCLHTGTAAVLTAVILFLAFSSDFSIILYVLSYFFLSSLFLSSVGIVYFHFSQSLGTCMFSLVQPLVFLCSCQVLNVPSELIFLLLSSHCKLVKSKFHMDIITVGYICFLNCSSVLLVTFKLYM